MSLHATLTMDRHEREAYGLPLGLPHRQCMLLWTLVVQRMHRLHHFSPLLTLMVAHGGFQLSLTSFSSSILKIYCREQYRSSMEDMWSRLFASGQMQCTAHLWEEVVSTYPFDYDRWRCLSCLWRSRQSCFSKLEQRKVVHHVLTMITDSKPSALTWLERHRSPPLRTSPHPFDVMVTFIDDCRTYRTVMLLASRWTSSHGSMTRLPPLPPDVIPLIAESRRATRSEG